MCPTRGNQKVRMKSENKQGFVLAEMFAMVTVLALFSVTLIPAVAVSRLDADLRNVAGRGKDIFVAIIRANIEREPLGIGDVWPKTQLEKKADGERDNTGIAAMTFPNSTRYFYELYDGEHVGQPDLWCPYVVGFDYSKLAGAGVPEMTGTGELRPENNMWCIAGNVWDEMDDVIPILVTRNVDCGSLRKNWEAGTDEAVLRWSKQYNTPFADAGFVVVRKGGSILLMKKNRSLNAVYSGRAFRTTVDGGQAPLVYLTPDGIAHPQ